MCIFVLRENIFQDSQRFSQKEKNAVQAEREYRNYLLLWMVQKQEESVFEGTVSSVKEWGVYVKLTDHLCEGLVSLVKLKKLAPFYFDKKKEIIINKKTGEFLSFGKHVSVKIEKINLNYREMDLTIV